MAVSFWEVDLKYNKISGTTTAVLCLVLLISMNASTQSISPVAPGAMPQPIKFDLAGAAAGGPSVDVDGNVYFSLTRLEPPRTGGIQKWNWADGRVTKQRDVAGGAIGTAIDLKGRLLVGEWSAERITVDDMKGNITVLADSIDGRKLMDPNAIAVDRKGGIYFTETGQPVESGEKTAPENAVVGGVDYISTAGASAKRVADLQGARKLILSPDGRVLIASGAGNKVWKFSIAPDGTLNDQTAFCTAKCANPVAFDESGRVYMLGDQLYINSITGEQIAAIPMPQRFSNAVFAGKDRKTLFMTGHDGVYVLQMAVRGALTGPELLQRGK
jgi:gluconolactonase